MIRTPLVTASHLSLAAKSCNSSWEMETRKRPHVEDTDVLHPKKRPAIDSNGSPSHINGVVNQDEPKDGDNLELFRKEAIFRRMKHYSRENQRSQSRIEELEKRKNTCEAGMAAMEACWTQLISVLRSFVKPEDLRPADAETREMFNLAAHMSPDSEHTPELADALRSRLDVTEQLVSAFVQLGGKGRQEQGQKHVYSECQKAQTECAALRSELGLMRSKLTQTTLLKDTYHADLVAAESRIDRLQSKTLPLISYSPKSNGNPEHGNGEVKMKDEDEEVKREKPLSPSPDHVQSPSQSSPDSEALAVIIKSQEEENSRLQQRLESLQDQVLTLEKQQIAPSEEYISKSPYYKILLDHASQLEHKVSASEEELRTLRTDLDDLHASHKDFEDAIRVTKEYEVGEITMRLKKRDVDNVRLREHRDQLLAELTERKHTESVKLHSMQELKTLSESRSERISILQSELKRLRAQLVVDARDEDLMQFILNMSSDDVSYIEDLKARLSTSEARVSALETALSTLSNDYPDIAQHIQAEAEARQKLIETTKRLESYQNVYGESSSLPADVQALSAQLRKKEQELEKMRLEDTRHIQAETSLYTELDKLSTAWEALDRQVKSKVFDLSAMEERLTKSALDKAKSENKFYSAMRDKEAVDNERKNLMRNVDKQAKVVEKLLASEKSLQNQISDRDKSIYQLQKLKDEHFEKLETVTGEKTEWQTRAEGEAKRVADLGQKWSEASKLCERLKSEQAKVESALAKSNKEVEKHAKLKASQNAPSSVKEAQLQGEVNKCMSILKCSTCKLNMRTTVITKCMHTFCKQCVDARISTRQRKCPACNLAFAQSDVQQLYFQ